MRESIEALGRSPVKFRAVIAVLAVWATPGIISPGLTAAASRPPKTRVLVTTRCSPGCGASVGVYKVSPRHIYLSDDFGGTLTLRWSSWHMRSATGEGSSYAALAGGHITAHVRVSLGEWANGEFLYMGIRFTHVRNHDSTTGSVRPMRNHYEKLGEKFDEDGQPAWLPLDQLG
ncbi:MAG: hypothetical protein JSS68_14325 [Actinobacteria bacterium]|nr:hypothetical protein [Actinomycetota bacterium]MBS1884908.1 hypothetical protein [Actinomycetota bacterium]